MWNYANMILMVSFSRRFANMYIGWGHKYNAYNYSPSDMPPVQDQYKIGPEIMEIRDPTVKEEGYQLPPTLSTGDYFKKTSF